MLRKKEKLMKKLRFFIPCILFVCSLVTFAGCAKSAALTRPTAVRVDESTLTLTWKEVPNARRYVVNINGTNKNASKNSYSLISLDEGDYVIKVKACASDKQYADSEWSAEVRFTRERETGLALTLPEGKKEYSVDGMGTASGDVVIPDTYRGKPVTSIAEKAFSSLHKLTSVTLGANITSIGAAAFNDCENLERVTLNDKLAFIGESAFQSCAKLSDISLPDSVSTLGKAAFGYCERLKTVSLGAGLKEIGESAFANCKSLTDVVIPDGVTALGNDAFSGSGITEIKIGKGIEDIPNGAFFRCSSLASVEFGGNVESIGSFAFAYCSLLGNVVLPDTVTEIGMSAFFGCGNLTDVTLGAGVKTILAGAFWNTGIWNAAEGMVYIGNWLVGIKASASKDTFMANDFKTGLYGVAGAVFSTVADSSGKPIVRNVTLPDSVKVISAYAFDGCDNLVGVAVGGGVKVVSRYMFNKCENLRNVILASYKDNVAGKSSVEVIEDNAFDGCASLEKINLPDTLTSIGANAFDGCEKLGNIAIPASVKRIGANAFVGTALWNTYSGIVYAGNWAVGYRIEAGVEPLYDETLRIGTAGIAEYAFQNVTTVNSITMPDSVKYIGRGAFYNCEYLTDANLPVGLERIEDYTFYKCKFLMGININRMTELKYIGRSAFYQCELIGLEENVDANNVSMVIPDSVEEIGDYAFYKCGKITYDEDGNIEKISGVSMLRIGGGVKRIGNLAFYRFASLKTVLMGTGVQTVGEKAFYKCENLSVLSLGDNLETIGDRAFYGCASLEKLAIPDSVETIGNYAFGKCVGLTDLALGSSVRTIGNYAFYGCSKLGSLRLSESVTSIGKQAFRNCTLLRSVAISSSVTQIGAHAFYGCENMTVYAEATSLPETWNLRWNSSYRPVFLGATLSADKDYVLSFNKTADSILTLYGNTVVNMPYREGYTFEGWTDVPGGTTPKYTAEGIVLAPDDGTTWYAVWKEDLAAV